jgi:hypothetical protein
MPQIDETGSTNVLGGLNIFYKPGTIKLTENGVALVGSKHVIANPPVFAFGLAASRRKGIEPYLLNTADGDSFIITGIQKVINMIKKDDNLVINSKQDWKEEKGFAILIPNESNSNCPIDLVEIKINSAKLSRLEKEKKLFIDIVNKKVTELEEKQTDLFQTQQALQIQPTYGIPSSNQGGNK